MIRGELCWQSWYGGGRWTVEVIKETPKRYLIRALISDTMIPGGRKLNVGETAYVDKTVVAVRSSDIDNDVRTSND